MSDYFELPSVKSLYFKESGYIYKMIGSTPMFRDPIRLEDVDYMEFNEAFASQVIATMKELNYPLEKVNVNGGSLAIGHPLGATGVRLVGSLARQLKRANKRYGVAAQCIGSGMGIATVIENKTVQLDRFL